MEKKEWSGEDIVEQNKLSRIWREKLGVGPKKTQWIKENRKKIKSQAGDQTVGGHRPVSFLPPTRSWFLLLEKQTALKQKTNETDALLRLNRRPGENGPNVVLVWSRFQSGLCSALSSFWSTLENLYSSSVSLCNPAWLHDDEIRALWGSSLTFVLMILQQYESESFWWWWRRM